MQNKDVVCPYSNIIHLNMEGMRGIRASCKREIYWFTATAFTWLFEFVSFKAKSKRFAGLEVFYVDIFL